MMSMIDLIFNIMDEKQVKYNITLPNITDQELKKICHELKIDSAEVFRRALALFNIAINADEINIIKNNEVKKVIVK